MRKVFFNKWFFLALLLTLSLSAFSFYAYKKTSSVCTMTKECCRHSTKTPQQGEMIWDAFSRQLTSLISIQ
jgi:hypothetical protein